MFSPGISSKNICLKKILKKKILKIINYYTNNIK